MITIGISSQYIEIANGWMSDASGNGEIGSGRIKLASEIRKTASGRVNLACGTRQMRLSEKPNHAVFM